VSAASLRLPRRAVNAERQAPSTRLALIAFTRHAAEALVDLGAATQSIATETLSSILGTGHAVSLGFTVSYALSVGNGMLSNVGECDTVERAVTWCTRI